MSFVRTLILALMVAGLARGADDYGAPAASDDAHNHDGTHPAGSADCGTNYMLPGQTARLGSHSFVILGQDGQDHIVADHRSGTPPHNYHIILRVRLDPDEMAFYQRLKAESKLLPAFTTIYFDAKTGKQLNRTFFCLADLPKIFGPQKKAGDIFHKLFPIHASLQKDADHEGSFSIESTIYRGGHFTLNREDVEILVYKYLPSYLPQDDFRKAIKANSTQMIPLIDDAPISQNDHREKAEVRQSYMAGDGQLADAKGTCPSDFYLKGVENPKTIHSFLLLNETPTGEVLAVHYYDQAPHNYQTLMRLKLSEEQLKLFRDAKKDSKSPPLFQTYVPANGKTKARGSYFCMRDIRDLVKAEGFQMDGVLYRDSELNEYRRGEKVGELKISGSQIDIGVNRILQSLMNPRAVAKDVMKKK
jgi:hypothetical protein